VFEAALELYGVTNIRDLPEDKKAEFFIVVDSASSDNDLSDIEEDMKVKQAVGIASDKRYTKGNMSGAVNAIEKLKPGLSDHPQVRAVLKRQNENVETDIEPLDELKTGTLLRYAIKAGKSGLSSGIEAARKSDMGDSEGAAASRQKRDQRYAGQNQAVRKISDRKMKMNGSVRVNEESDIEPLDEDEVGYQHRYAVKNGNAVKDNPKTTGEKDQPYHVYADSPEHAVRKHAKMTPPGMKKEEVEQIEEDELSQKKKEQVVTVKHKDSGKELRIVKTAVADYQKRGYHPVKEELSPKQKEIDKNKNGKIDGFDLAHLRKKTEELSPAQKAIDKNKNNKIDATVTLFDQSINIQDILFYLHTLFKFKIRIIFYILS
jgi:hypothetical protein